MKNINALKLTELKRNKKCQQDMKSAIMEQNTNTYIVFGITD